jgi:hypothetical protein
MEKTLKMDSEFLKNHKLMDYSLLLVIENIKTQNYSINSSEPKISRKTAYF